MRRFRCIHVRLCTPTPLTLFFGKLRVPCEHVEGHACGRDGSIDIFEPTAIKVIRRSIEGYRKAFKDVSACRGAAFNFSYR